jgi:integrase
MAIYLIERKGSKLKTGDHKGKQITRFYLVHYSKGSDKRHFEKLPIKHIPRVTTYKDEKEKAQQILLQRQQQELYRTHKVRPKDIDKINFCKYYENYLSQYDKADVRMLKRSYDLFKEFLKANSKKYPSNDNFELRHLDKQVCIDYGKHLSSKAGLSGETPNNYFARFKKVLKQLEKDNLILDNPTRLLEKGEKVKKPQKHDQTLNKEVLTIDEIKILIKTYCGNEDTKRAFLFACFTGVGFAEAKKLTWSNVKNDKLKYERAKTEIKVEMDLNSSAKNILSQYTEKKGKIFNLPSIASTNKTIGNWIKRAEIDKHITFHCGRHTFAVLLLTESKTNLLTVSKLMGHASTDHTIKYLNYADKAKKEAIGNLPEIDF